MRNELLAPDRARTFLTMMTTIIVIFLAAIGFYGTQRYLVAAGQHEYAIRAAVGAGPRRIGQLVLLRGLGLALPGTLFAAPLAFIVVGWLQGTYVFQGVSPAGVAACVVTALMAIVWLATIGPARRAMITQPAILLRQE
jgi:ABC-type antimicrobial peptide transport system permease subunit